GVPAPASGLAPAFGEESRRNGPLRVRGGDTPGGTRTVSLPRRKGMRQEGATVGGTFPRQGPRTGVRTTKLTTSGEQVETGWPGSDAHPWLCPPASPHSTPVGERGR